MIKNDEMIAITTTIWRRHADDADVTIRHIRLKAVT